MPKRLSWARYGGPGRGLLAMRVDQAGCNQEWSRRAAGGGLGRAREGRNAALGASMAAWDGSRGGLLARVEKRTWGSGPV